MNGKTTIYVFSQYIILGNLYSKSDLKISFYKRNIFGIKKYTTFGKLIKEHTSSKHLDFFIEDLSESERRNIHRRIKFKKILKKN